MRFEINRALSSHELNDYKFIKEGTGMAKKKNETNILENGHMK